MLPQLNYCWQQLLLMDLVLLTEIGDLNRGGYTVSYEQVLANADGIKPSSTNGFITNTSEKIKQGIDVHVIILRVCNLLQCRIFNF